MISFVLRGGEAAVAAFVENLRYFSLAESLGGVESLVCHPASMTHAPLTPEALEEAGISPTLVRLSIGLEGADDLLADLENALGIAGDATVPALKVVSSGGE